MIKSDLLKLYKCRFKKKIYFILFIYEYNILLFNDNYMFFCFLDYHTKYMYYFYKSSFTITSSLRSSSPLQALIFLMSALTQIGTYVRSILVSGIVSSMYVSMLRQYLYSPGCSCRQHIRMYGCWLLKNILIALLFMSNIIYIYIRTYVLLGSLVEISHLFYSYPVPLFDKSSPTYELKILHTYIFSSIA